MVNSLQPTWTDNGDLLVNLDSLINLVSSFMLYVTIAFAIVAVVTLVCTRKVSEEKGKKIKNVLLGTLIGYSITTVLILGAMKLTYQYLDEKINDKFFLVVGLLCWVALSLAVVLSTKNKHPKFAKIFGLSALLVAVAYAIVLVVVIPAKKDYYEPLSKGGMYAFTAALVAVTVVLALVFDKSKRTDTTKSVSYAAMCLALSYALSYIKLFSLPQGGSVTFASMLPLMLYSYMFGAKKGLIAGVVYGLLQFIQSPQYYQSMQVLLDYPIAFGVLGLAGLFNNSKLIKGATARFILGCCLAVSFRYLSHVISGYYVFSSWAMPGYTAFSWAVVYNLFILVELAIIVAVSAGLFSSRAFRKQIVITE